MARPFDITTTSDTASTTVNGTVKLVFTVTNITPRPLRGSLRAKALDSGQAGWLSVAGDAERDFPPGLAHQVEVVVKVPAGSAAGKFRVRVDALSVANPDDDFTEGPTVSITLNAPAAPVAKPSLWWVWMIVGIVVVALIAVVAWLALRSKPAAPADKSASIPASLAGQPFADAKTKLETIGFVVTKDTKANTEDCPDRVISTSPALGSSAKVGSPVNVTVGVLPSGPDTCKQGFVWREAFQGDVVCVRPESRTQAAQDNQANSQRIETVPATSKDLEEIQRSNPKAAAVPKGDVAALMRYEPQRIFINPALPGSYLVTRCMAGYTERRARADDRICVTTAKQLATAAENDQADAHRSCSRK